MEFWCLSALQRSFIRESTVTPEHDGPPQDPMVRGNSKRQKKAGTADTRRKGGGGGLLNRAENCPWEVCSFCLFHVLSESGDLTGKTENNKFSQRFKI